MTEAKAQRRLRGAAKADAQQDPRVADQEVASVVQPAAAPGQTGTAPGQTGTAPVLAPVQVSSGQATADPEQELTEFLRQELSRAQAEPDAENLAPQLSPTKGAVDVQGVSSPHKKVGTSLPAQYLTLPDGEE